MGFFSSLAGKAAVKAKGAASTVKKTAVKAKDVYKAYKAIPRDAAALGARAVTDIKAGKGLGAIGRGEGLNTTQNTTVGALKGASETAFSLGRLGDKGLAKLTSPLVKSVSQTPEMQAKLDQAATSLKPVGTAQKVGYGAEKIAETLYVGSKVSTGQKMVAKIPVLGKTLATKAPKIVQAGIQAGVDGLLGAGQSVLIDLSKGEKDWNKIKKNAKTSAVISAALPVAMGSAGGLIKGASHQVGQKEGLLKGLKNVGEETLSGAGLMSTPQRALDRTGNLGYQLSKKLSKLEDSDNDAVSAIATKARDFTKNYLDDRAPILRDFAGKLREAGASTDDITLAANAQARGRTVDPRTISKAYDQRAHFQRIAAGDDVGRLADDTDTYADMLTKLETTRTGTEGAESLANVQSKLDDFLATKSPEQLEKIKQAHESTVRAFNQAELAEDVAAGLISKEGADAAMQKYPNYSKQFILDYYDDAEKASTNNRQMSRTLSEIGWKPRLEKARGDLEAMKASQANILSSMIREKKRALNSEVLTMVNLDKKNAAGVFEPVWTEADEVAKTELLGNMRIQSGFKEAIKGEIDNVSQAGRVELSKQKLADRKTAQKLAKDIREEARKKGYDVKKTFNSLFDSEKKDISIAASKEINNQTKALSKEAKRQAKIAGTLFGRIGSKHARSAVVGESKKFNKNMRELVAKELGFIDELSEKFSTAARAQADDFINVGRQNSEAAKSAFLEEAAEVRWQKIMDSTDEQLMPLLDDLAKTNADKQEIFQQLKTLRDKAKAANTIDTVPVFNNGVKEFYKVKDRAVLDYFKGVEKSDDNQLTSMLKFAADWTRKTATQYNPVFAFKNAMIDYQTAQSNLPAGMALTFDDWAKGFGSADELVSGVKKGKNISKESKELLDLGIPLTSFGRNLAKVDSDDLTKIIKGSKASLNPIKQIMSGVERSEFATRYAVVKAAKRAGVTDPNELRELARNATIDFSVSGQNIREFNKVIPFLNARVQGLRNTMKAIAKDPAGFTRKQQLLSIYPQLMVDQWNKKFDMSRIPEHERDNNLIFVIRETKDPETGKPDLIRFSIPRADGQKLFPIFMEALQDDTKTTPEKAATILKSLAEFTPVDQYPMLGGALTNTAIGLTFNKDWRGYDIVPASKLSGPNRSHRSENTSPTITKFTDKLADLTGRTEHKDGLIDLSPKKTEFIVKTLGGGVTTKALQAIDAGVGLMTEGKPPGAPDFGIDAIMSKIPGPGEILKSGQLSVDPEMAKQQAEIEQADKLKKYNVKEEADRIINTIMDAPVEERKEIIQKLQAEGALTEDVKDKIKDTMKQKKYVGGINPAAPNLVKSKQIVNYIDAAKTPEQKKKRLEEIQNANLLSDNVKDYMVAQKFVDKMNAAKTQEEKKQILERFAPSMSEKVKAAAMEIKKSEPYFTP